jgi:hypothetical protein
MRGTAVRSDRQDTGAPDRDTSSYISDSDICQDLRISGMTLTRARRGGVLPWPLQLVSGGRNLTPRDEYEAAKAALAAKPRGPVHRPGRFAPGTNEHPHGTRKRARSVQRGFRPYPT